MKCPCENCLTLSLCKNLDLHHLVAKCSIISRYLKVAKITNKILWETPSEKAIEHRISSSSCAFVHKIRISRIKQFIPHTYTMD